MLNKRPTHARPNANVEATDQNIPSNKYWVIHASVNTSEFQTFIAYGDLWDFVTVMAQVLQRHVSDYARISYDSPDFTERLLSEQWFNGDVRIRKESSGPIAYHFSLESEWVNDSWAIVIHEFGEQEILESQKH